MAKNSDLQELTERYWAHALAAILLASFLLKMHFLLQLPHIPGMDAGYYVWHVTDTVNGHPYLDEPPLVFLVAAIISKLAGGVMIGVKITLSMFSAAMAIPAYLIVKEIGKKDSLALFASFLASFSASNWWIADGHLKNIAGLFFGLFVVYFFIRALQSFDRKNIALLALSFLLMVGSHFSSAAYITAMLLPASAVISGYCMARKETGSSAFRAGAAFAAISIMSALAIIMVKPDLVSGSSIGTIGLQEGNRFAGPGAPGPVPLVNFALFGNYSVFSLLAFLGIYSLWKKRDFNLFAIFLIWALMSFLLTQSQFVEPSWMKRFEMMGFIPFAILMPLGAAHFGKPELAAALLLLASGYTLLDLFQTNAHGLAMPVSSEEYLGLVAFHQAHPAALAVTGDMALGYWLHGIGFDVAENPLQPEPGRQLFIFLKNPSPRTPPPNLARIQGIGRYDVYVPLPPPQMRP